MIQSYKELKVWKKSVELSILIYSVTKKFPREELYGIISQMRRAAVAIASNIAEGRSRGHKNEFIQFLNISYASAAELETQLIIAKSIGYLSESDFLAISNKLTEIMKMLFGLIKSLKL